MPHKRAKRSVRDQRRSENGADLAPIKHSISKEGIPKSVARVLNAAKVQEDWRQKKRKFSGEDSGGNDQKRRKKDSRGVGDASHGQDTMRIQPGESIAHFNQRVENSLRGSVRSAMQTSSALVRKAKKEEEILKSSKSSGAKTKSTKSHEPESRSVQKKSKDASSKDDDSVPVSSIPTSKERPKEFASLSTSAPRRLNDIVQAPPELKKLPRGVKSQKKSGEDGSQKRSLREGVLSMAQKAMLEEERERAIRLYREMKKQNSVG